MNMETDNTIILEANELICGQRASDYGSAAQSFGRINRDVARTDQPASDGTSERDVGSCNQVAFRECRFFAVQGCL